MSDEVGYGVFATRPIPRGTITWALDPLDQVFDESRVAELGESLHATVIRYTWVNGRGQRILCWDFGRFINHSCEANSLGPGGFSFEIAVRDIAEGEQLTSDYGALNLEEPFECHCGLPGCRAVVRPSDFGVHAPHWDEDVRAAFPAVLEVEQPLWRWAAEHHSSIARLVRRPDDVPSILSNQWPYGGEPRAHVRGSGWRALPWAP